MRDIMTGLDKNSSKIWTRADITPEISLIRENGETVQN